MDEPPARAQERHPIAHAAAGALAALQALVLSLAVVVLPAIVAYLVGAAVVSSTAPDDGVQVRSAVDVAMGIWLLGHGAPLTADGVTVSLAPLGITVLALFSTYVSAKRYASSSVPAWAAGTVVYALCTTLVAAIAGSAPGWSLAVVPLSGAVVGGLGLALGILARPDAPTAAQVGESIAERVRRLVGVDLVPATLRLGLRAGVVAVALLVGGAALLVAAWAVAGRATSSDIITALEPGWTGGIVLAVAQLALLPNLVLWAVAWLAGPGFAVGAGTGFTPFGTTSGPLPAIPLLGALPGEDWANPVTEWLPLLVVACGVVAGLFVWRRLEPSLVRWSDVAWTFGGIVGAAGGLVLLGQWVAGGAGGPGRLADIGADPFVIAGIVAAEVGGGAAAVLLGAKLDLASRRASIGDVAAWVRRPTSPSDEAEAGLAEPGPASDLAAELGLAGSPDDAPEAVPDGTPDSAPDSAPDGAPDRAREADPGT